LIRLENVSFIYEEESVLKDISLEIKQNQRVVLLGNNGSGKSTLLKLMAGLIFAKSGKYFYKENLITKNYLKKHSKEFRKEVAILFQNPDTMLFNPSVKEEIAFSLDEFDVKNDIQKIAKEFEIQHLLDKNPLTLSGGEKQKVAFAAIFATNPSFLLLDEPTANLDPKSSGWFIDFLAQKELTTVISTHNLSLAYELGDRAIVLDNTHSIIYDGDIKELFKNEEILLKANLMHKHKHRHGDVLHSHFHIHNWS